ncbi:MAG: hypothetical protein ACFBZ9_09225, partial [Sphingomonadales bacterium]
MTYKKYWLQLGVASAVLAAGLPVHAQDSGGSLFTEEIFVTAQKREENIQDVGISITALSGKQ